MSWYDVMQSVQSSGDRRRMAMLLSAMWAAIADGPDWVLGNALMNTYDAFQLGQALDGAGVGVTTAARMLAP
jgi:hypothetical protein